MKHHFLLQKRSYKVLTYSKKEEEYLIIIFLSFFIKINGKMLTICIYGNLLTTHYSKDRMLNLFHTQYYHLL